MKRTTPGPWVVEQIYDGGRTVVSNMRSCDRSVCVNATENARPRGYEATDANAQLIAAAPDLLEALKNLRARFGNTPGPFDQAMFGKDTIAAADAAIAKAEGTSGGSDSLAHSVESGKG